MRQFYAAVYQLALALWVGGLWAIGYVVAPVLFSALGDRQLAGQVAGQLFALIGWIGLACAAYLLTFLCLRWRRQVMGMTVFWLLVAMALIAAIIQFGVQPIMLQLKAEVWPNEVMGSAQRDRFIIWHGVSSTLYLIQSLLGAWLVVWNGLGRLR